MQNIEGLKYFETINIKSTYSIINNNNNNVMLKGASSWIFLYLICHDFRKNNRSNQNFRQMYI
jgi:hypothetical protein